MINDAADPVERFVAVRRGLETRWPESRISPTLDRIRTLTSFLGDPQRSYPVIHVTGTNGKTSTARMIESLLRASGLHTGLITSPHLADLRERIALDGEPISLEAFLQIHDEVAPVLELADKTSAEGGGPPLSFFEVMTALAFAAFADAPIDVAVVEVGMGGTWDATNVVDAQVAVVLPIGRDHSEYLGDELAEIAAEKSGIIKPAAAVVLAAQPPEALEVLLAAAVQLEATTALEGLHFGVIDRAVAVGGQLLNLQGLGGEYPEVFLPLFGEHQARNAAAALAAVESFFGLTSASSAVDLRESAELDQEESRSGEHPRSRRQLDLSLVRSGFESVRSPGRLEVVRRSPTVLVDAAHNAPGAAALADAVRDAFTFTHTVGVVGIFADKDATGILAALEQVLDEVIITRSTSARAIPVSDLAEVATAVFGPERVHTVERLDAALERAIELAEVGSPTGVGAGVLVTGSVALVGEARLLLGADSGYEEGRTRAEHTAPRGSDEEFM